MRDTKPGKCVFKSGGQYLKTMPHKRRLPVGTWTDSINDALLFDIEVHPDGGMSWPLSFMDEDPGETIRDYFRHYMFPAGRPEIVLVDVVERSGA